MKWYNIAKQNVTNIKEEKKYRDVYILDEIGGYGIYAKTFIRELREIDADIINLHIDSAGGSIIDGIAIFNALRAHKAEIHTYVDGIAASIASIIYLAGDVRYIPENAGIFTHLPMVNGIDMPNRKDLQEATESLDQFERVLTNMYVKYTGNDEETVRSWMENETWFWGHEAVQAGFATEVLEQVAMVARLKDLQRYEFSASIPQAAADDNIKKEVSMETSTEVEASEVVASVEETACTEVETVEPAEGELTDAVIADAQEYIEVEEANEDVEVEVSEDAEAEVIAQADHDALRADFAEAALEQEQQRKAAILEVADKFNKDGALNAKVIEALASDVTVEQFKDAVMETLSEAASSIKLVNSSKGEAANKVSELRQQLAECNNPAMKFEIAKKIKEAR